MPSWKYAKINALAIFGKISRKRKQLKGRISAIRSRLADRLSAWKKERFADRADKLYRRTGVSNVADLNRKFFESKRFACFKEIFEYTPDRAEYLNLIYYGMPFVARFRETSIRGAKRKRFILAILPTHRETHISVGLCVKNLGSNRLEGTQVREFSKHPSDPGTRLAEVPIKFSSGTVDIETFSGNFGAGPMLSAFDNVAGKKWAAFLLDAIIGHARKIGYKTVRIRDPRTLADFKNPNTSRRTVTQIRAQIPRVVDGLAAERGYKKEGDYYIINLQ